MRKVKTILTKALLFGFLMTGSPLAAQLYQAIRGTITDVDSKAPITGAAIVIQDVEPAMAAISDKDGNFVVPKIPVGRHEVKVSFVGYDAKVISELLVSTGKELVLNIELKESTTNIEEVVVKAQGKDKPVNAMTTVSSRAFTVEETRRYAGGLDDPGRLASVFAGVSDGNIESNGIIVRGNSPTGAIYRIEGVEVMNPNHFAGEDLLGGGFVSLISNQVLDNSDFLTGAFPAEYGNALSAVFDMNLRKGNNENYEHTFQAGVMGLDFASEGPIAEKGKASYLFNYRYSTFGLVQNFLPPGEGLPVYQDLCFNINIPVKQSSISVWGIGGIDGYSFKKEIDDKYQTAIGGIKNKLVLNNGLYINTSLTYNVFVKKNRWFEEYQSQYYPKSKIDNIEGSYTFSTFLNKKFNRWITNRSGFSVKNMFFDIDNKYSERAPQPLMQINRGDGDCNLAQAFSQMKITLNEHLMLNTGFHVQYLSLSNQYSLEPRFGARFSINGQHAISAAYGLHSQMALLNVYFIQKTSNTGIENPNKKLGFTKANHFVLAYDWNINKNLRVKIEPYYQYLFDVPVVKDSSFSILNLDLGNDFQETLVNKGKGKNFGIDFTLERFLNNGFYYLATASVFESTYAGGDNIWRNTRYNKNFMANILGGKEWSIDKNNKNKVFGINGRLYFKGGDRISPINDALSAQEEKVMYESQQAFEKKYPATYRFDVSLSYRVNKPRYSSIWSLQIMNLLYSTINTYYEYDKVSRTVNKKEEKFVLPSISWKVEF
ncbi:MAG TPA: TonB-dependent receptor [Bacteroidales bacterium]|nr:TonB-dependent receptor [Bacteroidales bacterium]